MRLLNKFVVELVPDTMQLAYLRYINVNLDIEVLEYADGSIRVTIPNMSESLQHRTCHISAYIESLNDLMVISQIKDIVSRHSNAPKDFYLTILSTPYTRYDRVMFDDRTDGFGAKCYSDFLNPLEMHRIGFFDCHSDVMINLIRRGFDVPQFSLLTETVDLKDYVLIAPDKGAVKKNTSAALVFDKVRNPMSGEITGMKVSKSLVSEPDEYKYLVVDDICEGGRTFIGCAELFREEVSSVAQLDIYVTHGIFTNNAVEKLADHYTNIYAHVMKKSVYESVDDAIKSRLHVSKLINI